MLSRVPRTPTVAEKPFVSVDPSDASRFVLNVPRVRTDSAGASWSSGASVRCQPEASATWLCARC